MMFAWPTSCLRQSAQRLASPLMQPSPQPSPLGASSAHVRPFTGGPAARAARIAARQASRSGICAATCSASSACSHKREGQGPLPT